MDRSSGIGTLDLLATPEFSRLLGKARRAPLIRRELTEDLIPKEWDADIVWNALQSIRRAEAYFSPGISVREDGIKRNWHTYPESLHRTLSLISAHTQRGSALDSIVDERMGERFITQQYVQEMLANLRLDGLYAEYEDIRAVLKSERPPISNAEQLAFNFHRIMGELGAYADKPFDPELLNLLYSMLIVNVSDAELDITPRSPLEPYYVLPNAPDASWRTRCLEIVSAIGSNRLSEPTQHPIMISMLVNCQFWHFGPFARYNNLMGCIASRLYLFKAGYPVFRYVPKVQILAEWRQGLSQSEVPYSFEESIVTEGLDTDWTAYYDTVMALMLAHVKKMERSLAVRKTFDDEAIEGIAGVPYLNYRQKDILRHAVLSPDFEVKVQEHRTRYNIAYATARADLEKLTELGFLSRKVTGQAFIYSATPDLRNKLASYRTATHTAT